MTHWWRRPARSSIEQRRTEDETVDAAESRLTVIRVPQTCSPVRGAPDDVVAVGRVPQTMLSPSASVPQTMLSPSAACPTRCCRRRRRAPHDVVAVAAVPHTMLSPSPAVPHTMLSPSRSRAPDDVVAVDGGAPDDVVAVAGRAPDDVVAVAARCPRRCCRRHATDACPRRCCRRRRAGRAPHDVVAVAASWRRPTSCRAPRRCAVGVR